MKKKRAFWYIFIHIYPSILPRIDRVGDKMYVYMKNKTTSSVCVCV